MSLKPLKNLFNKVAGLFSFGEKPALPYQRVVNLFNFDNSDYITELRPIWIPGTIGGIPTVFETYGGEPLRIFRADPEKKLTLYRRGVEGSIHGNPQTIDVPCSPSIVALEAGKGNGKMLTVMILDELKSPDDPYGQMVFGLYGVSKKDGYIHFKKILVPELDAAGTVTGMRSVDLRNEADITTALAYGKACAAQLMAREALTPGPTMSALKANQPDAKRLPWKKPPAP